MIAKLRNYRLSPKKANIVAELVRKKHVVEAVNILKFTNKKMAQPLRFGKLDYKRINTSFLDRTEREINNFIVMLETINNDIDSLKN